MFHFVEFQLIIRTEEASIASGLDFIVGHVLLMAGLWFSTAACRRRRSDGGKTTEVIFFSWSDESDQHDVLRLVNCGASGAARAAFLSIAIA